MRFEIRAGGSFLILAGISGLSFVVFAPGLVGGYKMAQSNSPDAPPVASVYPLPNPPPDLAKAPEPSSDGVASTKPASVKPAVKVKASTIANSPASSLSMDKDSGPVAPPRAIANVPPPAATGPSEETTTTAPSDKEVSASEAPASPTRHKPYNIQIDAVMDRGDAEQMSSRLQKLGYHAFLVPTTIGGQTWWRIRVGPYNSQDEASAAEQELRAKYKDSYAPN